MLSKRKDRNSVFLLQSALCRAAVGSCVCSSGSSASRLNETHQVVLLGNFQQQGSVLTVVGEDDVEEALVVQVEAAESRAALVRDL